MDSLEVGLITITQKLNSREFLSTSLSYRFCSPLQSTQFVSIFKNFKDFITYYEFFGLVFSWWFPLTLCSTFTFLVLLQEVFQFFTI